MGGQVCPRREFPFVLSPELCKHQHGTRSKELNDQELNCAVQLKWTSSRAMAAQIRAKAAQVAKAAQQAMEANRAKEANQASQARAKAANHSQEVKVESFQDSPDPLSNLAPFMRLRQCMGWWEKHAPQFVLNLISKGV